MTANIETRIEKLAEQVVFADPSDLSGLAAIHTGLEGVQAWADEAGHRRAAAVAGNTADAVESVILGECEDVPGTMNALSGVVSAFQVLARGEATDADAGFPALFDVASPQAEGEAAGPPEPGNGTRFSVTLPPYVDEAIFSEFLTRQTGVLEEMESLILATEHDGDDTAVAELRRQIHTLKGEAALLGLVDIERLCHTAEEHLQDEEVSNCTDGLLAMKDWLMRAFDAYAGKGEAPGACEEVIGQLAAGTMETGAAGARAGGNAPAEETGMRESAPAAADAANTAPRPESGESAAETGGETAAGAEARQPQPLTGDRELVADFILEASEHLEAADLNLLTLETDAKDADAMNAVFRAFHTIKGVAGFLALEEIQELSHEAENLLDQARKDAIQLTGKTIDLVFDAVDALKKCVDRVNTALSADVPVEPVSGLPELVARIQAVLAGGGADEEEAPQPAPPPGSPRVGDILVDSGAVTETALNAAIEKQKLPPETKKLGEILAASGSTTYRQVDSALERQREQPGKPLGEILVDMGSVTNEDVSHAVRKQSEPPQREKLGEMLVRSGEADARDVSKALRSQRTGAAQNAVTVREAVKVDADRLDQLVDMIGELVIAESMVAQSPEMHQFASTHLGRHVGQLDKITRELQVMTMSLRMIPVRSTFQKMARLVRDLSKKAGKAVEFSMTGEDTELDKTVVDKIGDPLVHMVRNAVDHGLEASADERRAAGKDPAGKVELRAFHQGGNIHIEIADDGRGLNRDAIWRKALERGLVSEGDNLTDREVWALIFEPGFSTAKQVTEVSGRGVGMDVVRRNIEALRGQIEIQSTPGKGSVFTIRLPLTLAIIDGMVIRVGGERYVLPTLSILYSLRPTGKELSTVVGRGEMLSLQGNLLPLFRLHNTFGIEGAVREPTEGTVVVIENDGRQVGLLIDEILGQQQIVIKSIGDALKGVPGIAGAAIMPDGKVGLILDVSSLVDLACKGKKSSDVLAAVD